MRPDNAARIDTQHDIPPLQGEGVGVSAAALKDCIHCGLPLSRSQLAARERFCCRGCEAVYSLIHDEGLERYYDLRQCELPPPAELRANTFAWLQGEWERAAILPGGPAGMETRRLALDVQGVHCAACVWLLEKLFYRHGGRHGGGRSLRINPALGSVELIWDPGAGELVDYLGEVERFGYRFGPARKGPPRRSRSILIRLGICVAAAMNVMSFSLAFYLGLGPDEELLYRFFGHLNLALASVVLIVGGWPFVSAAWRGLRRGIVHLDLPIAIGMLLGYAGSAYAYFTVGPEAAYFDTITIFVALMLVGRWLQEHVLERNRNSLLASGGIADLFTRRVDGSGMSTIPAGDVRLGDQLWIAPGDLVPVAGVLLHRSARVSLDWITGEADPLDLEAGGEIPAGAFNAGEEGFRISATEDFSDSRLNDLLRSDGARDDDEERANRPANADAPRRDLWHRVATIYVMAVMGLALLGFLVWLPQGARRAVEVAVAVLVITCPCALGLALPLGRELTHVWLRRRGVMLRRDDLLDRALRVRRVIFDKTGTVTRGRPGLSVAAGLDLRRLSLAQRDLLWNMTSRSNHPLSVCLSEALAAAAVEAGESHALRPELDDLREEVGRGLICRDEGHEYRLGRPDFALAASTPRDEVVESGARVVFAMDGRSLAAFDFVELLRADAVEEVAELQAQGYQVYLFSGDRDEKVGAVARELGIPLTRARGELSPEAKAEAVAGLDRRDSMMIGDGLNDALSFDKALCSATPAVDRAFLPQEADFYFLGDGIGAVRRVLQGAQRLRRVQRDNLIFAAAYNLLAVGLCLGGYVNPLVAAIMMPLSSVSIVGLTAGRLAWRKS